jgi:hypothetical protein
LLILWILFTLGLFALYNIICWHISFELTACSWRSLTLETLSFRPVASSSSLVPGDSICSSPGAMGNARQGIGLQFQL